MIIRKIIRSLSTALTVLIALLALAMVGAGALGIKPYAVLSGSMEPAYPAGSMIMVKPVDTSGLTVGTPITFHAESGTVVTHRITEVMTDETGARSFRTKGDANDAEDALPVPEDKVIGVPVLKLPLMGYLIMYVKEPPGRYIAMAAVVILLLMAFIPAKRDEKQ